MKIKSIIVFTCLILTSYSSFGQDFFSYYGIVKNSDGSIVSGTNVKIKIDIEDLSADETLYSEIHTSKTGNDGNISLEIGNGTVESGEFSTINWPKVKPNIIISIDTDLDGIYDVSGESELQSVPYAKYAYKAYELEGSKGLKVPLFSNPETSEMFNSSLFYNTDSSSLIYYFDDESQIILTNKNLELYSKKEIKNCHIFGDTPENCISFDSVGNVTIPAGLFITTPDGIGTTFQTEQTGNVGTSYSYLYINFEDWENPTLYVQNSKVPGSYNTVYNNSNFYYLGGVRVGSNSALINGNFYNMKGTVHGEWIDEDNSSSDNVGPYFKECHIFGDTPENCISFDYEGNVTIPAGLFVTTPDNQGNTFQTKQTGNVGTSYSYLYVDFEDWSNPRLYVQNPKVPGSYDSVYNNSNMYLLGGVRIGSDNAVLNCSYYNLDGEVHGFWKLGDIEDSLSESDSLVSSETISKLAQKVEALTSSVEWYGIQIDKTVSDSRDAVTRIGNMDMHRALPIQQKIKRCILNDDGSVNYYLHPLNSNYKDNGNTQSYEGAEEANLDGTDGQVMVEIPEYYYSVSSDTNKIVVKISQNEISGFLKSPKCYTGAYHATIYKPNNTVVNVPDNTNQDLWKLSSVTTTLFANNPENDALTTKNIVGNDITSAYTENALQYRGSRNSIEAICYPGEPFTSEVYDQVPTDVQKRSALDTSSYYTFLGKPASLYSPSFYSEVAKQRGTNWISDTYHVYQSWVWLLLVEYATRNVQESFLTNKSDDILNYGCTDGGLGMGATSMDYVSWSFFNGCEPVIPCGVTNSLGNSSGYVNYEIRGSVGTDDIDHYLNFKTKHDLGLDDLILPVASYRGIESPFGDIYTSFNSSVYVEINTTKSDYSQIWIARDPLNTIDNIGLTIDSTALKNKYFSSGYIPKVLYSYEANVKDLIIGGMGCIIPSDYVIQSSTLQDKRWKDHWADKYYIQSITSTVNFCSLNVGGTIDTERKSGLFYFTTANNFLPLPYRGSRLNYILSGTEWYK